VSGVHVRFAPSPTGLLHLGNARTALVNWLFARAQGGRFLLRMDDTDTARSTAEFARAIEKDMLWLGLDWDNFERQSERLDRYAAAVEQLKAAGRLYACYETPQELDLKRRLQTARRLPPVYDRAALKLTDAERARLESEGRKPYWRFRLEQRRVDWDDLVRGPTHIDTASLSDPVLLREDGVPLYTLASVVDDIDLGITHIVRGEDHVTNTGPQIELFEALGGGVPRFGHLAMLVGKDGEGLSKRLGSLSLGALREQGIEAMAVASLLARLGTSQPVEPKQDLPSLVEGFSFDHFGRAPARYDPDELALLSAKVLHGMSYETAKARLPGTVAEPLWNAVRGNIAHLSEAVQWVAVVEGPLGPVLTEPDYLAEAARLLPAGPFDAGTWPAWTAALKAATGRKGKALFQPLRLALTAREHGPEMQLLLPLIGPERARARLGGASA
jgi:glutamyl-tRNA synthetase